MADGKGGNAARMAAQDEAGRLQRMGLLDGLPANKATGGDIIWAAGSYRELGGGYRWAKEATPEALVCPPSRLARRAEKKRLRTSPGRNSGCLAQGAPGKRPAASSWTGIRAKPWNSVLAQWKSLLFNRKGAASVGKPPYAAPCFYIL